MKLSKTLTVVAILIGCICAFGQENDGKLEIATYIANAQTTGVSSYGNIPYGPVAEGVRIKIKSIGNDGSVKAEVDIGGREGKLSGKLDSSSKLLLEGTLVYSKRDVYQTKLKATVKDDTLINGKFIMDGSAMDWKGEFSKAVIVEEEEW